MVQNRARSSDAQTAANDGKPYSVSGKIDKNYNYNYRQYLKKRCMIADYDNTGGRQRSARVTSSSQHVLEAPCCTTDCSGTHRPSTVLTYKRNNWGFRKQGAVDNNLYIATKKVFANPCCDGVIESDRDTNRPVTPEPPNPPVDAQTPAKEEVEVPNPPIKSKEGGALKKR